MMTRRRRAHFACRLRRRYPAAAKEDAIDVRYGSSPPSGHDFWIWTSAGGHHFLLACHISHVTLIITRFRCLTHR